MEETTEEQLAITATSNSNSSFPLVTLAISICGVLNSCLLIKSDAKKCPLCVTRAGVGGSMHCSPCATTFRGFKGRFQRVVLHPDGRIKLGLVHEFFPGHS